MINERDNFVDKCRGRGARPFVFRELAVDQVGKGC